MVGSRKLHRVRKHARNHKLRQAMKKWVARTGDEVGRRNDTPGGMAHADKRFGPTRHQGTRVDFWLIPELQPAVEQRFIDIDRQRSRRLDRQKAGEIRSEMAIAKRRPQRRQHCEARPFTNSWFLMSAAELRPPNSMTLPP